MTSPAAAPLAAAVGGSRSFAAEFLEAWQTRSVCIAGTRLRGLDVGAGTARIPIALCRLRADLDFVAVDRRSASRAVERVHEAGLQDRIRFVRADGLRLPFSDASFDAAVSNGLVHHVVDRVVLLREMCRVLRPGGLLLLRDSLCRSDADKIGRILARCLAATSLHAPAESRRATASLTMAEARLLLAQAGLPAGSLRRSGRQHWSICCLRPPLAVQSDA